MSWFPWDLELQLNNLDTEFRLLVQRVAELESKPQIGEDMSKLHDKLSTLMGDLEQNSETVIANATENETGFQDIITRMEAVIEKMKKKIADDASGGSSTGGGSGAG